MKRIKIDYDVVEELRALQKAISAEARRTALKGRDAPAGLNAAMIKGWMSGRIRSARPEHLEHVLSAWRSLTQSRHPSHKSQARSDVTPEIGARLNAEAARTGLSWKALLGIIDAPPRDLTAHHISMWARGKVKSAPTAHLDLVLECFAAQPDGLQPSTPEGQHAAQAQRRQFTFADSEALSAERERTGVGAARLLRERAADSVPDGISTGLINSWTSGRPDTVRADLYDWALKAWRALPDKPVKRKVSPSARGHVSRHPRRQFTQRDRDALLNERARTGVYESRLIEEVFADSAPRDLMPGTINGWINRAPRSVRTDHFEWVLNAWRSLPDAK